MRMQSCIVLFTLFLGLLMPTFVAEAQAADPTGVCTSIADCAKPVSALLHYFALSIILEMSLTVIFNWRWFLKYADSRGLKTPIAILFAAVIVWRFELDVMRDVLNALGMFMSCTPGADTPGADKKPCTPSPWGLTTEGKVVTAFLLAGGSDAVYRILTKLGIRNPFEQKEKAAEVAAA